MVLRVLLYLFLLNRATARFSWEVADTAFDQQLYEDVLDAEECHRQVRLIRRNTILALQFADAGIRVPRGILTGNTVDLGNYYQCLGINQDIQDTRIQGKYCTIQVPLNQTFHLPIGLEFSEWSQINALKNNTELLKKMDEYDNIRRQVQLMTGSIQGDDARTLPVGPLAGTILRLAVCIPKPCTTQQAMTSFLFNLTAVGFRYRDDYCRLPNDKPWVAADYIAVVVFSLIGILTLISTSYDLFCTFYLKMDRKQLSVMYSSFSVYTNGKRMMNFPSGPGNLQCLNGMRSLAIFWVLLGHGFGTEKFHVNGIDGFNWLVSLSALWITSATITVDTFFTMAGVLLVYTSAGKMNGWSLLKNIHLFYLNRLVRIVPLLAVVVLLQASFFHRVSDGPTWTTVAGQTNNCRTYWWTTLLHVQNLLNPSTRCIAHSWYIAIDIQCYIVSPLILFWVLSGKKSKAWIALILGLLIPLTGATIYNFINDFPAGTIVPSRWSDSIRYMNDYYFFTLTRAPPFFVGMIFGYVMHLYRSEKVHMNWFLAIFLWICSLAVTTTIFFSTYFIKQFDWDNQLVDNLMNSFMRPAWAAALCWIIFACVHGYGGPVNWFLSLDIWKMPSRLSYAMFVFHYPIMFIIGDATVSTNFFSVPRLTFVFFSHLVVALIVSYLVNLLVDAPCSTIFKKFLAPKPSKSKSVAVLSSQLKEDKERAEALDDTKPVTESNGTIQPEPYHDNGFVNTGTKVESNGIDTETENVKENGNVNEPLIVVDTVDEVESNESNSSKPELSNLNEPVNNVDSTSEIKAADANDKNKDDIANIKT